VNSREELIGIIEYFTGVLETHYLSWSPINEIPKRAIPRRIRIVANWSNDPESASQKEAGEVLRTGADVRKADHTAAKCKYRNHPDPVSKVHGFFKDPPGQPLVWTVWLEFIRRF